MTDSKIKSTAVKTAAKKAAAKKAAVKKPAVKAKQSPPENKVAVKKKTRVRNPEQTREKLLQATIDLLAEKGPDALSLKEAAQRAQVSRGVAYQHFEHREHLLREATTWISKRLLESAKDIEPSVRKRDLHDVMEDSVNKVAKLVLNNREAARLLITDALAGKALDTLHPLYQVVIGNLESFKNSGNAKSDIDTEILTFIMLGTVSTLIMLSYLPHENDDKLALRYSQEWTRLLREGLIAKPSAKHRPASKRRS